MNNAQATEIINKGYRIRSIIRTLRNNIRNELRKSSPNPYKSARLIRRAHTLSQHFSMLMNNLHNAVSPDILHTADMQQAHNVAWGLWCDIVDIFAGAVSSHQMKFAANSWEFNLSIEEYYRYYIA